MPSHENAIARLISGAIDMHIHIGPESRLTRRQDALELTRTARDYGMRAIVLKNREYGTAALAALAQGLVPEVKVYGSFTMDNEAGGLNPGAVLAWIRMGAKVIWMPTATAANSINKVKRSRGLDLPGPPQTVLDAGGKILPAVKEILQIIRDSDAVLGTGHLSPAENFALVEEAVKTGIKKIVLTHVRQAQLMDAVLSDDEIVKLTGMGAVAEYSFWTCRNNISSTDPEILADSIKRVGAERCIMTTDFGQADNPPAPEGMKLFIRAMLENGIPEKEIEIMVKQNPARLLGIA